MNNNQNGWANWERQLNRKTSVRRQRADRKARRQLIYTMVGLLCAILLMMVLDVTHQVSGAIATAVITLALAAMCFVAGSVWKDWKK